jgi:hypothetical protein
MASGGARARSGPPPDRNAIRNGRSGADWIRLPASGRKGDPPAWPITRATKRELALWADLWAKPQALMWEAKRQELQVALYVRSLREAEHVGASVASRTLLLRQEEYLGLSEPGLARNRWIIVEDAALAEPTGDPASDRPIPISDARDRLRKMSDAG